MIKVEKLVKKIVVLVEIIIVFLILLFIGLMVADIITRIVEVFVEVGNGRRLAENFFEELIISSYKVLIGIEFIKMLLKPSMVNVLEVLIISLARFVVIEHALPSTMILNILAISILIVLRDVIVPQVHWKVTERNGHESISSD